MLMATSFFAWKCSTSVIFSTDAVPQQSITQQNTGQNIFLLQKMQLWTGKPTVAVPRCLATLLRKQISHPPFGHSSFQSTENCYSKMLQL